jgi:hypothetical protein
LDAEYVPGATDAEDVRAGVDDDREFAVGPTADEINAWAERERKRRQEWMAGPTADEKLAWARREKRRRLRGTPRWREARVGFPPDERTLSDLELALEGMGVLFATWPFQLFDMLAKLGRDFERRAASRPSMRRPVRERDYLDDEW